MLDLFHIAKVAHETNRAYCQTLGDNTQPPWADAPLWQRESAVEGVLAIESGEITGPEDSHKGWTAQKVSDGWVYGETKDPAAKTHPCLVPFAELPEAQRRKDFLFFAVVQQLIRDIG